MKEDHILIEQLNASSIEAFSALYDKYAGMVFNFTHASLKTLTFPKTSRSPASP